MAKSIGYDCQSLKSNKKFKLVSRFYFVTVLLFVINSAKLNSLLVFPCPVLWIGEYALPK